MVESGMNNKLDKIKKVAFLASFDVDQSWRYLERQKRPRKLEDYWFPGVDPGPAKQGC
jgi:hypothetical protein